MHALADAAELLEVGFLALDHARQHVARLAADRQHQVGERFGRATLVSLISVSFDVPDAELPSAMFCLQLRAACTI